MLEPIVDGAAFLLVRRVGEAVHRLLATAAGLSVVGA